MKVAIIIERFDISLGGAERSVSELMAALEKMNMEVHLLAASGVTHTGNVHLLCEGDRGRIGYDEFTQAVRKHLEQNKYDIVHSTLPMLFADVYQPRGGTYAETIIRNAASYESSVISWLKAGTSWVNLRRFQMLKAEEALCRQQKGPVIAALSQYVAEQFKAHYNAPPEHIEVIPNGIRIEKRADSETIDKVRGQILVKMGLQEATNPAIFLFPAHNFRLKGLRPLLRSLSIVSKLKNDRPPVIVVAGSGNAARYKLLAMRLGIYRRVLFLGSVKNISGLLGVCDAVVLPTFYDPCSRVILEGLAAGKPVITTSCNGASEFIEHGRHGMVIEQPEDTAEIAKALNYYSNYENVRKASDAIDKDRLLEQISIDRHASQLARLYQKILKTRGTI